MEKKQLGTWEVKRGLAEMLKGGVIMDVTTPEQAKIAEDAGAVAVMALERVPADIRAARGVAHGGSRGHHGDPASGDHPGDGQVRIGHFAGPDPGSAKGGLHRRGEVLARPTTAFTSISTPSPFLSCAAPGIWAKPCAGSLRKRRWSAPRRGGHRRRVEAVASAHGDEPDRWLQTLDRNSW